VLVCEPALQRRDQPEHNRLHDQFFAGRRRLTRVPPPCSFGRASRTRLAIAVRSPKRSSGCGHLPGERRELRSWRWWRSPRC
jgi:hypothetical protein